MIALEGGHIHTLLIRDLSNATITKLKRRAAENGRSLQSEVKELLERSAQEMTNAELYKRAVQFSKRFKGRRFTDSVDLLRGDRER
jgi:plasmid stability protein